MKQAIYEIVAAAVMAGVGTSAMAEDKVFFLLPNSATIRFESRDAPFFVEAMKKRAPQTKVIVQNAQGDPSRQQRLVEDAIAQGAKVIVYTSADANLSAGSLAAAAAAKVPVVLYDHDAVGGKALWSFPANTPWHASPMAYQFDGKEYIAIAAGSDIIAFGLIE